MLAVVCSLQFLHSIAQVIWLGRGSRFQEEGVRAWSAPTGAQKRCLPANYDLNMSWPLAMVHFVLKGHVVI